METGQDLQTVIYSQDGFDLRHRQSTASMASEIHPLHAGTAVLSLRLTIEPVFSLLFHSDACIES